MHSSLLNQNRLLSLDVFRGIAIVLMILVNSPGTNTPYALLEHSVWNGCTLADLAFPFFLFIVGITVVVSLSRQQSRQNKKHIYMLILKRSVLLLLIGLVLNAVPYHLNLHGLRYYGVLQRIAVCYAVASFLFLNTSIKTQLLVFSMILGVYWLVTVFIPVPGYATLQLTPSINWVAYFDRMLFSSSHLYGKIYDPEGFLSTFPAIATTLLGVLIGHLLISSLVKESKFYCLFAISLFLLALGWVLNLSVPINKQLWSSSYVLWTGGYATLTFCLCFYLVDVLGYQKWTWPFKVFGMNALFAYVVHVLLLKLFALISLTTSNGVKANFRVYVTDYLFARFNPQDGSLYFSLLFIAVNFLLVAILYQRRLFIKL